MSTQQPGRRSEPDDAGGEARPHPEEPEAPEQPARVSRAGRDLPAAIAVGVLLGGAVIASLLTVRQVFIGIVALAAAVSTVELVGAVRRGGGSAAGCEIPLVPVLVGGQAIIWLTWPFGTRGALAAFALTALACLIWRLPRGADGYLRDVTASVFAVAYVPLLAAFAALLVEPADGSWRALCFLIGVVCSDTGGYAAGVLFGRHPMAPAISPKKSWEGFAGSLATGIVGGALSVHLLLGGYWWQGVVFGAVVVASATVGDLVESLMKRDLGVKDMGTLLPGHGGLMDRMDSLLPSALVSWFVLMLFLPL